jgi:hypothetical protein
VPLSACPLSGGARLTDDPVHVPSSLKRQGSFAGNDVEKNVVRRSLDATTSFFCAYQSSRARGSDYRIDGYRPSQYPQYYILHCVIGGAGNVLSFAKDMHRKSAVDDFSTSAPGVTVTLRGSPLMRIGVI